MLRKWSYLNSHGNCRAEFEFDVIIGAKIILVTDGSSLSVSLFIWKPFIPCVYHLHVFMSSQMRQCLLGLEYKSLETPSFL